MRQWFSASGFDETNPIRGKARVDGPRLGAGNAFLPNEPNSAGKLLEQFGYDWTKRTQIGAPGPGRFRGIGTF
jgi:hypothetical protein